MFDFNEKLNFINKNNDVLCVGELLIDMISSNYEDNIQSETYNKHFGGSPANIVMNIKKLGGNSSIVSCVGKDSLGDFLVNKLNENSISTENIERSDYSTSMVVVTKSKNTPIPIFYRGADYNLKYTNNLEEILKNSKIVHFSCWPISQKNSRETIEKIINFSKSNGILIGFDPNYHIDIWEKTHNGIEYIKNLIKKVDIIKPSEVDAERIFGNDTPINQIKKFIDLGAKLVIMTLGKDGAIVSNGKETIEFQSYAKEVIDTTGAGDAFWSGFYTGITQEKTLLHSLKMGFLTSSIKLQHIGAIAPLPTIKEIEQKLIEKGDI